MEDLKRILAGNIVSLRRRAGWTQLELAEKLHYSDKAVSKWERGESVPDLSTLMDLAALFSVSVDYLLHADHPEEKAARKELSRRQRRNRALISAMSVVLVWLIATWVFVNIHLIAPGFAWHSWLCFVYAVPASSVVALIFNSIWGKGKWNFLIISILVWSVLASVFLSVPTYHLWPIFLLGIPAQVIIILWSRIRN